MSIMRHIAIGASIAVLGLAAAGPSRAATGATTSPAFERCMAHYGDEWRDWSRRRQAARAEAQAARAREADEHAAAWDELATSPGISAALALDYRGKARLWRKRASERAGTADPGASSSREVGRETSRVMAQDEGLSDFCGEIVAIIAPPQATASPEAHAARPAPAAKPRRIKRARSVERPRRRAQTRARTQARSTRPRPRLSLGIGFIGVGF